MKILLLITSLDVGGAERLVTNLADRFVASGHEVVLAYLHGEPGLRPADSWVRLVNLGMAKRPLAMLKSLWRLRRLIREFRPDVVNSHLVHANLLARLVRLTTPVPRLVSSAHNTNEGGGIRMSAYRWTDRLADISTNVSEEAGEAFIDQGAVRPGRMIPIRNGIDAQAFAFDDGARQHLRGEFGVGDSASVILAVGRLCAQKDYPNLLRAFARLDCGRDAPQLLIVGDGPEADMLVELASSLNVDTRVHFLGVRHDVRSLMSAADIFALSSAWEGLPVVLLEAMACERFIVATDCGGVRSLVGDTGLLVSPHDSDSLASSLMQALRLSEEERHEFGARARARVVEHYSVAAMAEQYLAIFRDELSS